MVGISTPLLHFFKTQAKNHKNASKNKAKTFEIITSGAFLRVSFSQSLLAVGMDVAVLVAATPATAYEIHG